MRREWIEMQFPESSLSNRVSLPPCGGSGLKFDGAMTLLMALIVSLHAEGVD